MTDYTDRRAAIDAIPEVEADIFENCGRCELLTKEDVVEILQGLPSAEAESVKSGRGIEDNDEKRPALFQRGWLCSACGSRQSYGRSEYCPNCGAKMDAEEGEVHDA